MKGGVYRMLTDCRKELFNYQKYGIHGKEKGS